MLIVANWTVPRVSDGKICMFAQMIHTQLTPPLLVLLQDLTPTFRVGHRLGFDSLFIGRFKLNRHSARPAVTPVAQLLDL